MQPGRRIEAHFQAGGASERLEQNREWLATLARIDPGKLVIAAQLDAPPEDAVPLVVGPLQAYLPLAGMVDREQEAERLGRELEQVQAQIRRLEELLAGPFADRAPAEVVDGEREKLTRLRETAARLGEQLGALGA